MVDKIYFDTRQEQLGAGQQTKLKFLQTTAVLK